MPRLDQCDQDYEKWSDWRKRSRYRDFVEPGCKTCRVELDRQVCSIASDDKVVCPVSQGRFRQIYRAAHRRCMEKKMEHVLPSAERLAMQEGKLAKLFLERAKLVKTAGLCLAVPAQKAAKKGIEEVEREIRDAAKLASKYARECAMHANAAVKEKEPEFDPSLMDGG